MAVANVTDFGFYAKNKTTSACEFVDLPGISSDTGNIIVAGSDGGLFAPSGAADGFALLESAVAGDTDIDGTVIPVGCTVTNFYNSAGTKIATHGHSVPRFVELPNIEYHNTTTDQQGGGVVLDNTDTYNVLTLAGASVTNKMVVIQGVSVVTTRVGPDISSDDNLQVSTWVNGLLSAGARGADAAGNDRNWDQNTVSSSFTPQPNGDFTFRYRHIHSNTGAGGSGEVRSQAFLTGLLVREYI